MMQDYDAAKNSRDSYALAISELRKKAEAALPDTISAPTKSTLKIVYRRTAELIPYANNARTHTPEQVNQIVASINEFGWTNPILIDETNNIIAGHGRVLAADQLSMDAVPTIQLVGLSDAQKKAYTLADNKLALNAGWDSKMLLAELDAIKAEDFDISFMSFDLIGLSSETDARDYKPTLTPDLGDNLVTGKDVVRMDGLLSNKFSDTSTKDTLDFDCPHCGKFISISRDA